MSTRLPRRVRDSLAGAVLALGAPIGLLALRAHPRGFSVRRVFAEMASDPTTYAYVALSTAIVFAAFGYVLGRQADRLVELLSTDVLTGLHNRRLFQERLDEELVRSRRYEEPVSLLLIDVDGLKTVNDRHGHRAGDVALRAVANAIASGARATDLCARWGGDEFVLLAPHTSRDESRRLAERVRGLGAVDGPDGAAISISIGIATHDPAAPATADELLRVADAALYEAKRGGRNRVAG